MAPIQSNKSCSPGAYAKKVSTFRFTSRVCGPLNMRSSINPIMPQFWPNLYLLCQLCNSACCLLFYWFWLGLDSLWTGLDKISLSWTDMDLTKKERKKERKTEKGAGERQIAWHFYPSARSGQSDFSGRRKQRGSQSKGGCEGVWHLMIEWEGGLSFTRCGMQVQIVLLHCDWWSVVHHPLRGRDEEREKEGEFAAHSKLMLGCAPSVKIPWKEDRKLSILTARILYMPWHSVLITKHLHCLAFFCLLTLWFKSFEIVKNSSSFYIVKLPEGGGRKPPVFLSVGAAEAQTVNKEADRASEENSIYHPLRLCRNAAIWVQQLQSTAI